MPLESSFLKNHEAPILIALRCQQNWLFTFMSKFLDRSPGIKPDENHDIVYHQHQVMQVVHFTLFHATILDRFAHMKTTFLLITYVEEQRTRNQMQPAIVYTTQNTKNKIGSGCCPSVR